MKKSSIIAILGLLFGLIGWVNYHFLKGFLIERYISATRSNIDEALSHKKNATLALAIAAAECAASKEALGAISSQLREHTRYKNVWFKIADSQGRILLSTTKLRYYHRCKRFAHVQKNYGSDIIIDCYGLHIGAFVPRKDGDTLIAITHLNSIIKDLQRYGIHAATILAPSWNDYAKALDRSIGGYKLTSYTDPKIVALVDAKLLERVLSASEPVLHDGYVLDRYPIKSADGTLFGWIVYTKSEQGIFSQYISWALATRILVTFGIVLGVVLLLFRWSGRQREKELRQRAEYFYNILDRLQEIVLINDGNRMKYANSAFFRYFDGYRTLQEFMREHACICDFFVPEEGFITSTIEGQKWTEYILAHPERAFYAKVRYNEKEWIFQVRASRLEGDEYVVIFIDVTDEYHHHERLKKLAIVDPLTKLYNRYYFEKIAKEKIEEATLGNHELLFAMIDVDDFKRINDTSGHDVGDRVLQTIARLIRSHFRSTDPAFRVGGEEFLVIFETKVADKILQLLEKLRQDIAATHFDGVDWPVTVSIGVARFHPGDTVQSLYKRADEALYASKRNGKNRITYKE